MAKSTDLSRRRAIPRPFRKSVPPLLVAIVGGSGSGKSWLAERLAAALGPRAARLALDDFYRDRSHLPPARRARINFDHPRAIDWVEFKRALEALRAGRPARLPRYDFQTHSRRPRGARLAPKPIILAEGLWLLHRPSLRRLFAVKLFIDCPARIRLQRRLARDLERRGRTPASVEAQFRTHVEPMHLRFVAPQARLADRVLGDRLTPSEVARLARRLTALTKHPSGAAR